MATLSIAVRSVLWRVVVIVLSGAFVLIACAGLFFAYVVPRMERSPEAKAIKAKLDIQVYGIGLSLFHADTGRYPTFAEGLEILVGREGNSPDIPGYKPFGYIQRIAEDPWGNAYLYCLSERTGAAQAVVCTQGSDGRHGGLEYAADYCAVGDVQVPAAGLRCSSP